MAKGSFRRSLREKESQKTIGNKVVEQEVRDHENVIFLALSTLPWNPKWENYTYDLERWGKKERWHFLGYSQLEPGTKYFLNRLALQKERVDRIVVVGTNAVLKDSLKPAWRERFPQAENVFALYKARILEYLQGMQEGTSLIEWDGVFGVDANEDDREHYRTKEEPGSVSADGGQSLEQDAGKTWQPVVQTNTCVGLYEGVPLEGIFRVINTQDEEIEETYFWDIMKAIRGEGGKEIHLYMDTQGGIRDTLYDMNVIAGLLKDQKVQMVERIATDYLKDRLIHRLQEVSDRYRQQELLTASHVFKKYGWGAELEAFFMGTPDQELARAIQSASDAVKVCDMESFDKYLVKIGRLIRARRQGESGELAGKPKTRLDLILGDIEEDYGQDLLSKDTREPLRYVKQIRWCLKKNFIQQALTILESKMPREYVRCGLRYYCDDVSQKDALFTCFEEAYGKLDYKDRYKMMDVDYFYITRGFSDGAIPKKTALRAGEDLGRYEKRYEDSLSVYEEIRKMRNSANHAANTDTGLHEDDLSFFEYMHKKHPEDRYFKYLDTKKVSGIPQEIRNYLDEFERLYGLMDPEKVAGIVDLA